MLRHLRLILWNHFFALLLKADESLLFETIEQCSDIVKSKMAVHLKFQSD